jgi:hypothetical protein
VLGGTGSSGVRVQGHLRVSFCLVLKAPLQTPEMAHEVQCGGGYLKPCAWESGGKHVLGRMQMVQSTFQASVSSPDIVFPFAKP